MYYNQGYVIDDVIELHHQPSIFQESSRYRSITAEGTSLHQAARDGALREITSLLNSIRAKKRDKVNELDESKLSPLHYAAKYNYLEVAKLLVENGADVNKEGQDKATPLHYAASFKRSIPANEQEEQASYNSYLERYLHRRGLLEASRETADRESIISFLVNSGAEVNRKDEYRLTPLHFAAIRSDDVAVLELMRCNNIDINALDKQDMMPLHLACLHGRTDITALLLFRRDAKIRQPARDEQKNTPLHFACLKGHTEIVKLLFSAGEVTNCLPEMLTDKQKNGGSPLYLAAGSGEEELVELFFEYEAEVNQGAAVRALTAPWVNEVCCGNNTPLHAACESGSLETVDLLLQKQAKVNSRNTDRMTPLHKACEKDRPEIVKFLLQKGANIESEDIHGFTPLLTAAKAGQTANIDVLLRNNANIEARDKTKKTAIIWAAEEQNIEALQILLKHPNAKVVLGAIEKRKGNTALHIASEKGFLNIVKLLLSPRAIMYAKNKDQNTPVRLAIQNGHVQCILEFVKQDRSFVNDEDENFNTPLHLAASAGHSSAVKVLIDAGADLRARNISLWTPLDCAASKGCVESATLLIDAGCPINVADKAKITPLHLASKNGHVDMVEFLLERNADVSLKDSNNNNCLDLAIDKCHSDVALAIVRHKDWKKAMFSVSTDPVTGMRQTPLRKLIKLMPDVAEEVLNACLIENGNPRHRDYSITFNYELLDDMFSTWESNSNDDDNSVFGEDGRLVPSAEPYSHDKETLTKNHPLHIMVRSRRDNLLGHPVVTSLLDHKWASCGRGFYYTSLFIYLIFLTFFTGFIIVSPPPFFVFNNASKGAAVPWRKTGKERWEEGFSPPALFLFGVIGHWIIIGLSCLNLLKEVIQLFNERLRYINWENMLDWCLYILAILAVLPLNDVTYDRVVLREDWQWKCGAFGIFLAWMNLILFIQNVPQLGIYVVMFTDVLKTFLKFCVVFFLFVVSFAMAFYTLLTNQQPFHRIGFSIVKTFVMMIGEFDFDAIFHSQDYVTAMELDETSDEFFLTKLFYSGATYTIFILFAIIMSILIMNLLVGLAVDDIQAVQEQAKLRRFCMQVNLAFDVHRALPMFIWRRSVIKSKAVYPNAGSSGFFRKYLSWLRGNNSNLTDAITTNHSSQSEEIHLLIRRQNYLMKDVSKIKEQIEATNNSIESIKATNESIMEMIADLLKK